MITEAEARAAEADAAARRERDTAKVCDGETVEGTCACLATSAIFRVPRIWASRAFAHTVTHLCPPPPSAPLVNRAQRLRAVLGSLTGAPPPGDEVRDPLRQRTESRSRAERAIFSVARNLRVRLASLSRDRSLPDRASSRCSPVACTRLARPTLRPREQESGDAPKKKRRTKQEMQDKKTRGPSGCVILGVGRREPSHARALMIRAHCAKSRGSSVSEIASIARAVEREREPNDALEFREPSSHACASGTTSS